MSKSRDPAWTDFVAAFLKAQLAWVADNGEYKTRTNSEAAVIAADIAVQLIENAHDKQP